MRIISIKKILFVIFLLMQVPNTYAQSNELFLAQKRVNQLTDYAFELKKLGYSQEEIFAYCSDLLNQEQSYQEQPALSPKTKKILLYGSIGVVTTVCVAGVVYFLLTQDSQAHNQNQNNQQQAGQQNQAGHHNNFNIRNTAINLVPGDIVHQHFNNDATGAIVNAANQALQGGGGVDGAVHRAAGIAQLQRYCRDNFPVNRYRNRCQPGDAVITPGFNLAPRRIIHAVAARVENAQWRTVLAQTYTNCLRVADAHGVNALAFSSLGTGFFGCDPHDSSRIAINSVRNYLADNPNSRITEIRFVCWGNTRQLYENALTATLQQNFI